MNPRVLPPEERLASELPPLENGDRLTREEFERRYDAMPGLKKAELIEGVVYVPSPVSFRRHSRPSRHVSTWLGNYEAGTPGVEGGDNSSVRLDDENEPQPDCFLRLETERGGRSRTSEDDIVEGAPELVFEVASSSASYDLHQKLGAYRRHGVLEYVVWRVRDRKVDWFVLEGNDYKRREPESPGLHRSREFPGLWLDPAALIRGDLPRLLAVLDEGLRSPEHASFVERLRGASPAQ